MHSFLQLCGVAWNCSSVLERYFEICGMYGEFGFVERLPNRDYEFEQTLKDLMDPVQSSSTNTRVAVPHVA
jgi:hypothetical protein